MAPPSRTFSPLRDLAFRATYPLRKAKGMLEALRWRAEYRSEMALSRSSARPGPLDVVLVMDHLKPNVNAGKLVRTADAMGAREIRTIGMPYFNVRPTVESLRNIPLRTETSVDACFAALRSEGYAIFALEPERDVAERTFLDATTLPRKTAIIVGHESRGVSFSAAQHPDVVWLSIRQFGRVPCLNASVAGSIALYEYARQHGGR